MPSNLPSYFSLQTWTLRHNFSPRRSASSSDAYKGTVEKNRCVLEDARRCGYTSIEVSARGHMQLKDFLVLAREIGLSCSGLHLPCLCSLSTSMAESVVSTAVENIMSSYPRRAIWKNFVLTFMGDPDYLQSDLEKYKLFANVISGAMKSHNASSQQFAFAYHLYDFDLSAGEDCIKAIIDTGCNLVLDTYYLRRACLLGGEHLEDYWQKLLECYTENILVIHMNDTNSHGQQTSLGKGIEHWINLFAYFGQLHKLISLVVEHEAIGDAGPSMAQDSATFLLENPDLLQTYWRNRSVARAH